jgi:hypothetical protein
MKRAIGFFVNGIVPSDIYDGHTLFWYQSDDLSTITKGGTDLISSWRDKLGSGRDLLQINDLLKPLWNGYVLFDGAGDSLKTSPFAWNQPEYLYLIIKQKTWFVNSILLDGNASGSSMIYQSFPTPKLTAYAGINSGKNSDLLVDTWGIVRLFFNGASSKFQVDANAAITWNCGVNNMGGFTLGSRGAGGGATGNIEVFEIIGRDSINGESNIYDYLVSRKPV